MTIHARVLHANKFYIVSFLVFILSAFTWCCLTSKSDSFIALNFIHTQWLDKLFTYYTFLGDGLFTITLIIALLVFRKYFLSVHLLLAFLSTGLIAQLLKQMIYTPRPRTFFAPEAYSGFIDGVTHGGWASFPSGHTVTAFATATVLALHARNKIFGLVYLLLAIGVAYSRVYLGQHFLEDVLAGSLIGVFFGSFVFIAVRRVKFFRRRIAPEPSPVMQIQ